MTKPHSTTQHGAVIPTPGLRLLLAKGCVGLLLGAGMTILAVMWSNGTLGLLSLVTVFGTLVWLSLGLIRHFGARFRRS